jgi:hypothetical protein
MKYRGTLYKLMKKKAKFQAELRDRDLQPC